MDSNRRMRSSNVQGFSSKMLTLYEEEVRRRRIRKTLRSTARLYAHAQFNFYIVFLCNGIYNIPLLSAVTEKRVSAAEAHNEGDCVTSDNVRRRSKPRRSRDAGAA